VPGGGAAYALTMAITPTAQKHNSKETSVRGFLVSLFIETPFGSFELTQATMQDHSSHHGYIGAAHSNRNSSELNQYPDWSACIFDCQQSPSHNGGKRRRLRSN